VRQYPEIEFHVITSGLEKPGDLDNVIIHSNISDADYMQLCQESDVLFMPLESATANNVILEGIACGLPVISSDLPSVRVYLPGEEAFLVKDNQPGLFADILRDLSSNPEKRTRASEQARLRAEELSWPNIARQFEVFYTEITGRRQHPASMVEDA